MYNADEPFPCRFKTCTALRKSTNISLVVSTDNLPEGNGVARNEAATTLPWALEVARSLRSSVGCGTNKQLVRAAGNSQPARNFFQRILSQFSCLLQAIAMHYDTLQYIE